MTTDPTAGPGHPHRPTCPPQERRLKQYEGKYGDLMAVCQGCGLVAQVSTPADPLTTPAPPPDGRGPAERAGARYVCRMHPDQAVTWTGRGCPRCAREAAERPTPRRRRRAQRRRDLTDPTETE